MVDGEEWRLESAEGPAILAATAGLHHSGHRAHHHREGVAGFSTRLEFGGDHPFRGGEGLGGGGTWLIRG